MNKNVIIDCRMRKIEKDYLKSLGFNLIELSENKKVYPEISAHVDIFCAKIDETIFTEGSVYEHITQSAINKRNIICGKKTVLENYPNDIPYNVCQIGNNIIHNFKYTDDKILEYIKSEGLNMININQGYSKCSIAVISNAKAIVTDEKIAFKLQSNNIQVLLLKSHSNIKLFEKNGKYSKMNGFVGGTICRVKDKVIVFGDINNFSTEDKENIKKFVKEENLQLVDFKGYDLIDYGSLVVF